MRLFSVTIFILLSAIFLNVEAQQKSKPQLSQSTNSETKAEQNPVTKAGAQMTLAFAEVFAQKVETEAELKILSVEMTDDAPQITEKKMQHDFLQREIEWLENLPTTMQSKMTLALGKMIVRKIQAEVDEKMLTKNYADEHPLVKKARARLVIYKNEIDKLLQ